MITAALPCDFLPFEVLRASGIHPFVIPCTSAHMAAFQSHADVIIAPVRCCAPQIHNNAIQKISVDAIPDEYGDTALNGWKTLLGTILKKIHGKSTELPESLLRAAATEYSSLRRLVRGIALLRRERPGVLSNADLRIIFSSSLSLLPEMIIPKLSLLLDALNGFPSHAREGSIPALVYGRCFSNESLLDDLEKEGFIIVEDDTCGGRRSFDLSYNTESAYLYDEIINAFSFRPFCPCLRSAASRFELLYRLAASYGIGTVIFIDDGDCPARTSHISSMRPRLMRLGIDPLLLSPENAVLEARRYVELASR